MSWHTSDFWWSFWHFTLQYL